MNRRNFLKGFLAATTVAALAPTTLVEVPVTETTRFVSFEEIARITLRSYRNLLASSITDRDVIWKNIIQSRKADGSLRCGTDIVEPILTGLNV